MVISHLVNGRWESSKMVPILTVNCFRHALHLYRPLRHGFVDPGFGVKVYASVESQCGQTGPFFQIRDSRNSRAASSSVNRAASVARLSSLASIVFAPEGVFHYRNSNRERWVCQVQ